MRIFDETKTYELLPTQIDYNKGRLVDDKKFIMHHEAIQAQAAVYIERLEHLPNGSAQIWKDLVTPAVESKDAYDEYEDIQVYIPYTAEELKEQLRNKRIPLLNAFDKWEKAVLRNREQDDYSIMLWYQDLLNLQDTAFTIIPERIKYYLKNI